MRASDGTVRLRPLLAGETWVVREVFAGLSEESRQRRFHTELDRLTPAMATALAAVDGRDHVAIVAEVAEAGLWRPVGIARLVRTDGDEAELAIEIADAWQGRGIGRRLVAEVRDRAGAAGMTRMVASILVGNQPMLELLLRSFPDAWITSDGRTWEARASIPAVAPPARERLVGRLAALAASLRPRPSRRPFRPDPTPA